MSNQEWVSIVAVEDEGIWVESMQKSACGRCSAQAGCGQRALNQFGRSLSLWVPLTQDMPKSSLHVGQSVLLTLPKGGLIFSAWVLYGVPLFSMLMATLVGQHFSERVAILLAFLGLGVGIVLSRWLSQRWQSRWQPSFNLHSQCVALTQL